MFGERIVLEMWFHREFIILGHCDIVSRKLPPRNPLLTRRLSRILTEEFYNISRGTILPMRWLAPEVFDERRYSRASDVWAFGVLMWEAFSRGETPYSSIKNIKLLREHVAQGNRLSIPDTVPERLRPIMARCWLEQAARPSFTDILAVLLETYADAVASVTCVDGGDTAC